MDRNWLEEGIKFEQEEKEKLKGKILEKYIERKNRRTTFNWEKLFQEKKRLDYSGRRTFENLWDASLSICKEKGILTYPRKGSYFIIGNKIDLSPTTSLGTEFNFNDEEEAEKYILAEYGKAQYSVSIARLEEIAVNKK